MRAFFLVFIMGIRLQNFFKSVTLFLCIPFQLCAHPMIPGMWCPSGTCLLLLYTINGFRPLVWSPCLPCPVICSPSRSTGLAIGHPYTNHFLNLSSRLWIHSIPISFPVLLSFFYQFTRDSYRVAYGVRFGTLWNKCFGIPIFHKSKDLFKLAHSKKYTFQKDR